MHQECPVCMSEYINPQMLGCGHSLCLACIQGIKAHCPRDAACPECRQIITQYIPNYALNVDNTSTETLIDKMKFGNTMKAIIHDNSGSMRQPDGAVLEVKQNGTIVSHEGKFRYQEANQRTIMAVEQSIHDEQEISVYLLNPVNSTNQGEWVENEDFVTLDKENYDEKKPYLEALLNPQNIHGRTPLPDVTRKITTVAKQKYKTNKKNFKLTLIFNTDGEPNDPNAFERELKTLIRAVPCVLIFNVITDDQHIVNYYDDVDMNLNKGNEETCAMIDTMDDYKSEAMQVFKQNPEFVYTLQIHKWRISGHDHIVLDMMDERPLSAFYRHILIKLILKNNHGMPELPERDDPTYYDVLDEIAQKNIVFDPISKRFKPFINVQQLKRKNYVDKFSKQFTQQSFTIIATIATFIVANILLVMFL